MHEGLALGLKSVAVAVGSFALLFGLLDVITAIQEGRPLWRALAFIVVGVGLAVPVFVRGIKSMLAERVVTQRDP